MAIRRVLMPTDGSAESEKPLTMAAQIARAQGADVTLLRVVEELGYPATEGAVSISADLYTHAMREAMEQAGAELAALAARLRLQGVSAHTVVRRNSAAAGLLDYLESEPPDLVVMATHGRTGLARFAMGSVTDRVVREGTAPVLVTRMGTEPTARLDRALVMLDGSGLAEQALPLVTVLAGKPLRHLLLYRTIADPADRSPAATYLAGVAKRLATEGVDTEVMVDLGDPRPNVERAARDVDVVVLCTHGRGGFDRLRHGSVAEHVMRAVDTPALLVRAAPR